MTVYDPDAPTAVRVLALGGGQPACRRHRVARRRRRRQQPTRRRVDAGERRRHAPLHRRRTASRPRRASLLRRGPRRRISTNSISARMPARHFSDSICSSTPSRGRSSTARTNRPKRGSRTSQTTRPSAPNHRRGARQLRRARMCARPAGRQGAQRRGFSWWQLANLRMVFIAGALRRRLGHGVEVRRVQYRRRGWNSPQLDAVRDAEDILDQVRQRYQAGAPANPKDIVLVGHSMGGRVAARLASGGGIGAVVALAPWWPREDGDLIPARTRLLVVHGTADTRTDPRSSRTQTSRARQRGLDAQWAGIEVRVTQWCGVGANGTAAQRISSPNIFSADGMIAKWPRRPVGVCGSAVR